jgi:hypothetical protein
MRPLHIGSAAARRLCGERRRSRAGERGRARRSEKGRGKRAGDELYLDAKLRGCGIWMERDGTAVAQSFSSTMAAARV